MPELTEERKALIKEFLADLDEKDEQEQEQQKSLGLEGQIAALREEIADLQKPDTKNVDIDPQENGDPCWGYSKGMDGLSEMGHELHQLAIGKGMSDRLNRIQNATKAAGAGLQENVDAEGGFLIPEEHRNELLQNAIQKSDFMSRTTQIPMAVNTVNIPYIKDTDHSGGTIHGGVRLYWVGEEAALTKSRPDFGQVQLSLNKLVGLAYASSEILEDSPISIGPLLNKAFTDAWPWQMDYEVLNGSGTGRPRGILNEAALISQAKETGQVAATIVSQNIIKMYSRMPAANKRNAIWIINEDVFPALATMTIDVGMGGVPVYLPANSLAGQPHDTLMGKPLIQSEHCQTLGTVGDIYFADLTQYLIGTKAGSSFRQETSIHLKFDTDESAFRFVWRVDGKSWWPSAITPRHSSTTLSPFIALATRS
jgi:HK97 family phage major capsid protein